MDIRSAILLLKLFLWFSVEVMTKFKMWVLRPSRPWKVFPPAGRRTKIRDCRHDFYLESLICPKVIHAPPPQGSPFVCSPSLRVGRTFTLFTPHPQVQDHAALSQRPFPPVTPSPRCWPVILGLTAPAVSPDGSGLRTS